MKRIKQLEKVIQLAEMHEQQAAKEFSSVKRKFDAYQAKLDKLQGYRTEYQHRFRSDGMVGMNSIRLSDFHTFMVKVETAIKQEQGQLQKLNLELEEKRALWQQKYQRLETLNNLKQRYNTELLKAEYALEQKLSDERNILRHNSSYE